MTELADELEAVLAKATPGPFGLLPSDRRKITAAVFGTVLTANLSSDLKVRNDPRKRYHDAADNAALAILLLNNAPAILTALRSQERVEKLEAENARLATEAFERAREIALGEVMTDRTREDHGKHCHCVTCELNEAEDAIRAMPNPYTAQGQ